MNPTELLSHLRRPPARAVAVAVALAVPMSQVGHALAYMVRFGPSGTSVQSSGAHAYFPVVLQSSLATVGSAVLLTLLMLGAVRFMVGVRRDRVPEGGWPLLPLLGVLLLTQLAIFGIQEVAEASASGLAPLPPSQLAAWGLAGQLPIAALTALGLAWISARVRRAIGALRRTRPVVILPRPARRPSMAWEPVLDDAARRAAVAAAGKRGPPVST